MFLQPRRCCPPGSSLAAAIAVLASAALVVSVRADYSDYTDLTFQCPYLRTCPNVCVTNATLCPSELTCRNATDTLCIDGTCAPLGSTCPSDASNPCEDNSCKFSVTCARSVVDTPGGCAERFGTFYAQYDKCEEDEPPAEKLSWTGGGFVFCYVWVAFVTAIIVGWCAYNQRIAPVGVALPLDDFSSDFGMAGAEKNEKVDAAAFLEEDEQDSHDAPKEAAIDVASPTSPFEQLSPLSWTQTAYKTTVVGKIVYWLTVITFWGFQVLLAHLVAFFYAQQNETGPVNPFRDEVQVLAVFEVIWVVGFFWSFALKWPSSIHSIFLRRCTFDQADYVAVFAPSKEQVENFTDAGRAAAAASTYIGRIRNAMSFMFSWINSVMAFVFSDITRPDVRGGFTFCPVMRDADDGGRSFYYRLRRYNFDADSGMYVPGRKELGTTIGDYLELKNGLDSSSVREARAVVGPNRIDMKRPTFIGSLVSEFNRIFYTYQLYITWTWFNFWYWYMGIVNTIVYVTGGISVSFVMYQNALTLYQISEISGDVEALRDGQFETVPQDDLVPGDVVKLSAGITSCDMVLLSADNVIVDESALTGEATPVAKTQLDPAEVNSVYSEKVHKKNTIFAGTTIIGNENNANHIALVTKTGSFTSKGELLRDILFYERHRFKFDVELELVLLILVVYAAVSFGVTVSFYNETPVYSFFYGMYVVATAIPPLLPTVFVVSVGVSSKRLLRKKIACSNAEDILVAGKVKIAFFDKTGTLTKQGLDFLSVESYWNGEICLENRAESAYARKGMAACHTLSKIEGTGQYLGNSVDVVMFEASGASMGKNDKGASIITQAGGNTLTILKRFDFDHSRMTQSVVVMDDAADKIYVFVKGSADSIKRRCKRDTIPQNFGPMTTAKAKEGIYQISLAMREMPRDFASVVSTTPRDKIEVNLDFVGFVNFKNVLRAETPSVLKELEGGDIRTVMLTGDSVFTGIHIAMESGMIKKDKQVLLGQLDHTDDTVHWTDARTDKLVVLPSAQDLNSTDSNVDLAMTGEAWAALDHESKERIGSHVRVFGRCTPNDKIAVVNAHVEKGLISLMCGDGGNDCGALKTAHVGIALSDAEASVVAPFTSLDKCISSVPALLKEGRCGLASAFSSYKYMIMYGQVETLTQIMNAYYGITFSEWGWFWMDGVWLLTMAFSLPLANAAKKLYPMRPTASLLGPHTMSSAVGVFVINFFFIVIGLVALKNQDWYQCRVYESTDVSNILFIQDNYETEVIWLISGYQYISTAMAYNFGFEFRAAWIRNYIFVALSLLWTIVHYYVVLVPSRLSCFFRVNCVNEDTTRGVLTGHEPVNNPWNHTVMPESFRNLIAGIITLNLFCNLGWEYFIVNGLQRRFIRKIRKMQMKKKMKCAGKPNKDVEMVEVEPAVSNVD